jgi:hypothetical protein
LIRLRSPREKTVPQRLKPRGTLRICGTAEAVPFHERVFPHFVKSLSALLHHIRFAELLHGLMLLAGG